jgi:hypothetical protein
MGDQWLFKSNTYDNCNCNMNCGCQFNLPSTHGYCQSAYFGDVEEGHFNDVPLNGLRWAALYKWPGEVAEGDGTRLLVIDERADDVQRKALEAIVGGEACAPLSNVFAVYRSCCSNFLDTLFMPIELETDLEAKTATARIRGIVESEGRPLINEFSGQSFDVAIERPSGSVEFTHADLILGNTNAAGGIEMSFEDSFAMFCVHHFNQNGLVRS